MRKLLSRSNFRKLSIINLLFYSKSEYVEKQFILDKMEITMKTLNKDISEINEFYATFQFKIEVYQKNLLYLKKAPEVLLNNALLGSYMIYNSDIYNISKLAFRIKPDFVEQVVEFAGISKSSAYSRLEEFDDVLAANSLFLDRSPLNIVGNELNIRFFYFHLFEKSYPFSGWEFPEVDLERINSFIEKLAPYMGIYLSPIAKIDYAIAISVCLVRIRDGYYVKLTAQERKAVTEFAQLYSFSNIDFTELEASIGGVSLPDTERHLIILSLRLTSFTFFDDSKVQRILDYNKQFRPSRYLLAEEIAKVAGADYKDLEMLKAELLAYFSKFTFLEKAAQITDIDYFSRLTAPDQAIQIRLQHIIDEASHDKDLIFVRKNKSVILAYVYEFVHVAILSKNVANSIKIKVLSKKGPVWEQFMKYEIRKRFPEKLVIFSNELESKEHLKDYDLIVSDYPAAISNEIPILIWNMPPTKQDLKALETMIYKF